MKLGFLLPILLPLLGHCAGSMEWAATLDIDGVTLSGPMSNCSSPLSPSTGVTGLSVFDTQDGHTRTPVLLSVTTSGCTLTTVLGEAENAEDTVVFSLSAGSNLTDSMSNTPLGQTTVGITNNSEWHAVGGGFWGVNAKLQGGISVLASYTGGFYPQTMQCNSADCYFEFFANASAIDAGTFDFSGHYILQQGTVDSHDWGVASASTTWSQRGLVTGLSGIHIYRVVQVNSIGVPFQAQLIRNIRITGSVPGLSLPSRTILAEQGDSVVVPGGADATTDDRYGHMWNSTEAMGAGVAVEQHSGISGEQVCGGLETQANRFSSLGGTALVGYMRGGSNDVAAGKTPAQLRTCWDTWLANVQALMTPPTHIIAMGIETCCSSGNVDYTLDNAQIALSCAASQSPSDCTYVNPTLWVGFNQKRQSDGIHLNFPAGVSTCVSQVTGEDVFCNRYKPVSAAKVLGSSFTLTGPVSGKVGAASDAFIVTLRAGAVFAVDSDSVGRQTVNCNDGGQSGTFTPSVGSPGTGTVAITQTSGPDFSFTYTPNSTGNKVITCTPTQQGWAAPGALTYSSTSGSIVGPGVSLGSTIQSAVP